MKAQVPFREGEGVVVNLLKELFLYCDLFMGTLESSFLSLSSWNI